jgi:hypothetical protein
LGGSHGSGAGLHDLAGGGLHGHLGGERGGGGDDGGEGDLHTVIEEEERERGEERWEGKGNREKEQRKGRK